MATRSSTESGFRQLAGEPGYVRFLGAATFARVADEMFSAVRAAGSLMQVVRDGLRALVEVPQLLGTTAAGALNLVGAGFLTVAFPFFLRRAPRRVT